MQVATHRGTALVEHIVEVVLLILSSAVISGINIVVSGHILGTLLRLTGDRENYIRIPLPPVLDIQVRGSSVAAGFSAFAISLLAVALFWTDAAKSMFIIQMGATDKPFIACELLATLVSVFGSVLLATAAWGFEQVRAARRKLDADTEQVAKLLEDQE